MQLVSQVVGRSFSNLSNVGWKVMSCLGSKDEYGRELGRCVVVVHVLGSLGELSDNVEL